MKRWYKLTKDNKNKQLLIQEYAKIDKETLSLLCEEHYNLKDLEIALKKNQGFLIKSLRTNNIYPIGTCMHHITEAVTNLLETNENKSVEISFDDKETTSKNKPSEQGTVESSTNTVNNSVDNIDKLLSTNLEKQNINQLEDNRKTNSSDDFNTERTHFCKQTQKNQNILD